MRLRDVLHAERREENARIHAARCAVWESEQPKPPICGWEALIASLWEEHRRWVSYFGDSVEEPKIQQERAPKSPVEGSGARQPEDGIPRRDPPK